MDTQERLAETRTFYEFFAGGGMARAGLGAGWSCLFANDFDPKKANSYAANWGNDHLRVSDVAALTTADLPDRADLAWASFPCQDLSLAEAAKKAGRRMVGTVYKRTRADGPNGEKTQRAEIRFDNVAGCLRTPAGGSSRQTIMVVEGQRIRSRLLSPREAARLMGLPNSYLLPENYNEAYCLAGDGVAAPVVRFLAEHILEPLLAAAAASEKTAA